MTIEASGARAKYGYPLALLTTIYVFNFLDRQVMTIVAEPIKQELGLADWQIGAMTGLAFALFYTLFGLPIARLAERRDRSRIIAVAVVTWSFFTIVCGFAQNFLQLVLARLGVGVGEAGCTPPAHSLISDIVPKSERASALAIYAMGAPIGQLLGVALGGLAADAWGWRAAFIIAGAPGIILALVAFATLREPRRAIPRAERRPKGSTAASASAPDLRGALRTLLRKKTFWLLALGASATGFTFYGHGAFTGSFFLRNHADALASAGALIGLRPIGFLGVALGVAAGVAGIAGAILGGRLADRWAARDIAGLVLLPAMCSTLSVPCLVAAMLVETMWLTILFIALAAALNAAWFGPVYAAALGLVAPGSRATASALLLFIISLVGLGCGPLFVGLISDFFAGPLQLGPAQGLRWAMIAATVASLFSGVLFWAARKTIAADTIS